MTAEGQVTQIVLDKNKAEAAAKGISELFNNLQIPYEQGILILKHYAEHMEKTLGFQIVKVSEIQEQRVREGVN